MSRPRARVTLPFVMDGELTICWTNLLDYERVLIEELAALHKAGAQELAASELASALAASLARGAVVMIASGDKQASLALSLGADEVVRSGELTARVLDDAIQRARVRAASRRDRDSQRILAMANERMAFALLAAAVGHELTDPAPEPGLERVLRGSAGRVLDVAQHLATRGSPWVDDIAPVDSREAERRASSGVRRADASAERAASLSRFAELLGLLEQLGSSRADNEPICVPDFLRKFTSLMARYVEPWASLEVRATGEGRASVPRVLLTCSLSAVLANALEQLRNTRSADPKIELRCVDREDCVLIEVEHNGDPIFSDLRPGVLDAYARGLGSSPPQSAVGDLAGVREHLRHVGSELLIDSSERSTLIRLFLPTTRPSVPAVSLLASARHKLVSRG